jgi:hypothetical protein
VLFVSAVDMEVEANAEAEAEVGVGMEVDVLAGREMKLREWDF